MIKRNNYILAFLMLLGSNLHAQVELNNLWLYGNDVGIEFSSNKTVESREFSYFSTYSIQSDTITIIHDYSGQECWTQDSLGNKIKCPDWKLPNSKFQILQLSESELILYPLNPSAMKIASELKQSFIRYSLKSYEDLFKKQGLEIQVDSSELEETELISKPSLLFETPSIDTVELKPAKSLYSPIQFDSIVISYFSQGWFAQYYYDLKLYADGQFVVNHDRIGPDKGEFENMKAILGLFEGRVSQEETSEINHLLSSSGISDTAPNDYGGWTSHGKYINFKVYYKDTFKEIKGVQGMFPVMIEPVIHRLLMIDDFEGYVRIDRIELFETTLKK